MSSFYVEKEIIRAEERDILRDVQTAFIPQETITPTFPNIDTIKVKRQTGNNENIQKVSVRVTNIFTYLVSIIFSAIICL